MAAAETKRRAGERSSARARIASTASGTAGLIERGLRHVPGHHLLQHLGRGVGGEEPLAGEDLEEHRAEGEDVAPLVGPHLDDHLGGHVGGLAGEVALADAAAARRCRSRSA